ncbi:hypothetical protein ES150_10920 [Enterobacillus tribolii]|nr:hypothetical protein [Enterobacillus tribolii]
MLITPKFTIVRNGTHMYQITRLLGLLLLASPVRGMPVGGSRV